LPGRQTIGKSSAHSRGAGTTVDRGGQCESCEAPGRHLATRSRVQKSADRLLTAYQEDLLLLDDLRRRMPELRKREQAIGVELSAIQSQLADRAEYLRLAETITSFLARLRATAKTLDVSERQHVVRLLVKEILVSRPSSTMPTLSHFAIRRRMRLSAMRCLRKRMIGWRTQPWARFGPLGVDE
jgi:hypothetical protein